MFALLGTPQARNWPMGRSAARPPAAPWNPVLLSKRSKLELPAAGCRARRLRTVPAARPPQDKAGTQPRTRDCFPEDPLVLVPRGPTALTLSHQMRPWCRHAGTPPPSMRWGSWLAVGDPPTQCRGLGKPLTWRRSPGCTHSASRSPVATCMRTGGTGLATAAGGPLASTRRRLGFRTGGPQPSPARRGWWSQTEIRPKPTGTPSLALKRLARGGRQRDPCMVQERLVLGFGPFLSTTALGTPETGTYVIQTAWSSRSLFIRQRYFQNTQTGSSPLVARRIPQLHSAHVKQKRGNAGAWREPLDFKDWVA